jgi:hypothetical protein
MLSVVITWSGERQPPGVRRFSRKQPGASQVTGQSDTGEEIDPPPDLLPVLESAARLQEVVPDAVLVGGTVSATYAGHRISFDHDHVLALQEQYEAVLEAVEATDGWATSVRASKPPMTIMGRLGGIEAGLRQLRRRVPLQTRLIELPGGQQIPIPTIEEALRVKAYLIVQRNQVRDYLYVAALADRVGVPEAATILRDIDSFYVDRSGDDESVVSTLVPRLARPDPRDRQTLAELGRYKGLTARWQDWSETRRVCRDLAQVMLDGGHSNSEGSRDV